MELLERAKKASDQFIQVKGQIRSLEESMQNTAKLLRVAEVQHDKTLEQYGLTERGIEVMKKLVEKMSEKGIGKLKKLLAFGMAAIFEDKNYSIDIDISERGDVKTAEFYLIKVENGVTRKERLRDSVGGGIQTVVSVILRIYFIIVLKQRRFVGLDESLTQLSDIYLEAFFSFLRRTIDELGFKYLWITHDPRFVGYADRLYKVQEGVYNKVR